MIINSVNALRNAIYLLDKGADKVNRGKILDGYLEMQEATIQAKAGMAVLRTQNQMFGALLDIYG